jgi:hypothetical protein
VPVTLAASFLVVLFLGGLLLYFAGRGTTPDEGNGAPGVITPDLDITLEATHTGTPATLPAIATQEEDLGILPAPSSTPWPTAPRSTPVSPAPPGVTPAMLPPSVTPAVPPALVCTVSSATSYAVNVVQWPGSDYPVVGTLRPDEFLTTLVQSGTGWYEVVARDTGNRWVSGSWSSCGHCDKLWLPAPTTTAGPHADGCFRRRDRHELSSDRLKR